MMRELDNKEREMTEKGLKRNQTELTRMVKALEMTLKHKQFMQTKREYEDTMRPFNRENEDLEIEKTIKGYEEEIKVKTEMCEELNKQLNEGVEVKEPQGVG